MRCLSALIAACLLSGGLSAQTFVDNLDGTSATSTFEGYSGNLPANGWTALNGSPRFFDSTNDVIISNAPYDTYGVQFVTSATLVADAVYTLSFRMGYLSGPATANSLYSFQIGTWDGVSTFTVLQQKDALSAVPYGGNFGGDPEAGVTESLSYVTATSVSTEFIAIRWFQTNFNNTGTDFFGFDNATLSYVPASAIPEPSTYAAIFGALALAGVVLRRHFPQR